MKTSETIGDLAGALSKAQGEIKGAVKDSKNPFFKSSYADLSSVWNACREALSKNSLAVIQTCSMGERGVCVSTRLTHASGQWVEEDLTVMPTKADPQGIGSTITYLRRYALAAITGVAPEDDDGNAATGKPDTTSRKPVMITNDTVDENKIFTASVWFTDMIDADDLEENYETVQEAWKRLSNNERSAIHVKLSVPIPGNKNNKLYSNALKEYLNYVPNPDSGRIQPSQGG